MEVLQCLKVDHCTGGNDTAAQCAEGYKGALCAVCDDGFAATGSGESLSCSKCSGSANATVFAGVGLLILSILALLIYKF